MITFAQDNLIYTISQITDPYFAKRVAVRILKNLDEDTFSVSFPVIVDHQELNGFRVL